MITSMTAFARNSEEISIANSAYNLEIRSLNQRFLEVNCRLPDSLRFLENELRARSREKLHRGKVDISITSRTSKGFAAELNKKALSDWLEVFAESGATATLGAPDWHTMVNLPGVLGEEEQDAKVLENILLSEFDKALQELIQMRAREGEKIADTIKERLEDIEKIVATINEHLPQIEKKISENLRNKLQTAQLEIDNNRFEQEVVYLLSKSDIREELDRLNFHIQETRETLQKGGVIGRRLDFLMQEFNREANTLGAKAVDNSVSKLVVDLKVIIEQMREQIQNIE
ncbi:MAG: YicC family protein [Cardiobacteriaceae bacterium]|nr:YicC family protein [Cardiobacteriaceae bacterium]